MQEAKEILKTVKKVELKTKRLVEGLLQGAYHSVFKGRGIEFSDIREYHFGDDIRAIDWNVTARTNIPHIKEYIEERDLTVYIVFDISGSQAFGSEKSKRVASTELAASLMFAAMHNNDNIGLLLFSEGVEKYIPPRKGRKHVFRLIRDLVYHEPKKKGTSIKESLRFLSNVAKKRSIIFLISDFFDEGYEKILRSLALRHDVIAVDVSDQNELELPDIGFVEVEDEETGELFFVDTSDEEFQKNYRKMINNKSTKVDRIMNKLGIDKINISSGEKFHVPLKKFFYMRERRKQ